MTNKGNRRGGSRIGRGSVYKATAITLACILLSPSAAFGWGTEEHIAFGHQIAEPFDGLISSPLPVLTTEDGPTSFGDWVSAPDFARSIHRFLDSDATLGVKACSNLWTREGVMGMETDNHDQSFTDIKDSVTGIVNVPIGVVNKTAFVDCADNWAINNNHFGDFARTQYNYYHEMAMEAAQRFRVSGTERCRKVAYTLEGWGQHYLTDSTASGHAWNPPGRYFDGGFMGFLGSIVNVMTGVGTRMKIHNYLNEHGARMAAPHYHDGIYLGDASHEHDEDGRSLPDRHDTRQWKVSMDLAQSGLGQIAAAVECGAPMFQRYKHPVTKEDNYFPSHFDAPMLDSSVLATGETVGPRRFFASNETMCQAMQERVEFKLPNFMVSAALEWGRFDAFLDSCKENKGFTEGVPGVILPEGHEVASCFFAEAYSFDSCFEEEGLFKGGGLRARVATRDPLGDVDLEDLGCPLAEPQERDAGDLDSCGNTLCEIPALGDGSCSSKWMMPSNGCCYDAPSLDRSNDFASMIAPLGGWQQVTSSSKDYVVLPTPGREPGDMAEFLWFRDDRRPGTYPETDWQRVGGDLFKLNSMVTRSMCSQGADALVENGAELACAGGTFQGCDSWGEADSEAGEIGGDSGQFVVYETRVFFPKTRDYDSKVLSLTITGLDEGLKVQVDGHVVAYVTRSELTDLDDRHDSSISGNVRIPLLTSAAQSTQDDGSHVIRLTHMNSCDDERALTVGLSIDELDDVDCARCDGLSGSSVDEPAGGCQAASGSSLPAAFLILLGLFASIRRRQGLGSRNG